MRNSFYGWYMKCQSDAHTLSIIPALHLGRKISTCSIQMISDKCRESVTFPAEKFCRKKEYLSIGESKFSANGIVLSIHTPALCVEGKLSFGRLTPLKYNIMGPFSVVPFMVCRHNIRSMCHTVFGSLKINGEHYGFDNALGYWEGDFGRSFPEKYVWTQCFFENGSVMFSVAEIPMMGFSFTGIIGIVIWKGREFRFATYLGAKVVENANGKVKIVQGKMELEGNLFTFSGYPLKAPNRGEMVRTIHESVACKAFYRFRIAGKTIFAFETERASFEYEHS